MADSGFSHSEAFLQWIWENLIFDFTDLRTTCGKELTIINPGTLNVTDGPDFTLASIESEGITWHGDVEIHTKSRNWDVHGHGRDDNFNTVILHVVAEDNPAPVQTRNGHSPYTLNILPYLSTQLRQFLISFNQPSELPCTSSLHFISEEAFYQQIEKAHTEYFEKKSNDFLTFYDPNLTVSKAWKKALILSVWDGLGISHNREPMVRTAQELLEVWNGRSIREGMERSMEIAGMGKDGSGNTSWNHKSVRPSNHPKNRIPEAVSLTHHILQEPFQSLLSPTAPELWKSWLRSSSLRNSGRMKILFGTVFLPSLYVLGNLLTHKRLSQSALSSWKSLKTPIPPSLLEEFRSFDVENKTYRKKLGAIHQLKSYCKPGKCSECFVLKKAIQS